MIRVMYTKIVINLHTRLTNAFFLLECPNQRDKGEKKMWKNIDFTMNKAINEWNNLIKDFCLVWSTNVLFALFLFAEKASKPIWNDSIHNPLFTDALCTHKTFKAHFEYYIINRHKHTNIMIKVIRRRSDRKKGKKNFRKCNKAISILSLIKLDEHDTSTNLILVLFVLSWYFTILHKCTTTEALTSRLIKKPTENEMKAENWVVSAACRCGWKVQELFAIYYSLSFHWYSLGLCVNFPLKRRRKGEKELWNIFAIKKSDEKRWKFCWQHQWHRNNTAATSITDGNKNKMRICR